jgi:HPt (histidine-containing phosphotransfer) domain-containing protein
VGQPSSPGAAGRRRDDGTPLPAKIEGVDLEIGIRRLAGNRRLLRKLLLEFLQDYRGVIDTIRTAIDLGHTESVMRLVHTLKGVAATIGANSVHYAARDLEAGFGKGDIEQYPPLLRNLEKAMAPVITSLTTLERETTSSSGEWPAVAVGTVEPERLRSAMAELLHLLQEGDAEAADRLAPLARELKAAGLANELDTLRSQLDNFDYEEAERTLRAWRSASASTSGRRS